MKRSLKTEKSGPASSGKKGLARKRAFQEDRELCEKGVVDRGEVGKRGKDGKLPPGVTHEVVEGEIVRTRYSAF
jgi:hypothetical protein